MAGTLEVSDDLCWMPAGWVYDGVLECIAAALQAERSSLADVLLKARTEENGGYLDLRDFRTDELEAVERAADRAYARLDSEGASSFSMPEYFDGFMAQFRNLREMFSARLHERAGRG